MKLKSIFLLCALLFMPTVCRADAFGMCVDRILDGANRDAFVAELQKAIGGDSIKTADEFELAITSNKIKIKQALVIIMFGQEEKPGLCNDLMLSIAKMTTPLPLTFEKFGERFTLQFNVNDLMKFYPVALGLVVSRDNFNAGDKIPRDYIKKKTWSDNCSDYLSKNPFDSVYDSDPVNVVTQKITGNSKDEFFLDEPEHLHAFPGLVVVDVTHQDYAELLIVNSIPFGLEQVQKFSDGLHNTHCSNQGLKAYLASYKPVPTKSSGVVSGALGTGGVAVGAALGVSIVSGVIGGVAAGAAAGTPAAGFFAAAFTAAGASGSGPVVGWIVAAAIVVVTGVVALVTSMSTETIADIPEMQVIDGPYPI